MHAGRAADHIGRERLAIHFALGLGRPVDGVEGRAIASRRPAASSAGVMVRRYRASRTRPAPSRMATDPVDTTGGSACFNGNRAYVGRCDGCPVVTFGPTSGGWRSCSLGVGEGQPPCVGETRLGLAPFQMPAVHNGTGPSTQDRAYDHVQAKAA